MDIVKKFFENNSGIFLLKKENLKRESNQKNPIAFYIGDNKSDPRKNPCLFLNDK